MSALAAAGAIVSAGGTIARVIEFAIDVIAQRVDQPLLTFALKAALPSVMALVGDIDEFDAKARLKILEVIDETLRKVGL